MIKSALISVFHKDGLAPIVKALHKNNVKIYSTGGTEKFIQELQIPVLSIKEITSYPPILNGRVKTLHPKVFGGILNRQDCESDVSEMEQFDIPQIDLVIVDLYPFEKSVASKAPESDVVENIDIGGISLIRASAKNFKDTFTVPSMNQYEAFLEIYTKNDGSTSLLERKKFAAKSFDISSHYDTAIFNYFNQEETVFKVSENISKTLRYGENPHQKGYFFGNLELMFDKLHGKELSYNNLLDMDAAVNLMSEFIAEQPTFAILKHNNACGMAQRNTIYKAYIDALASDPVSAFGGILISNKKIDKQAATEIHKLFCEVVIAPSYDDCALNILKRRVNRVLLLQKRVPLPSQIVRTSLNGLLVQNRDSKTEELDDLSFVTDIKPSEKTIEDLLFASKICKHTKSNAIILVKDKQLLASGTGQTSRVDALNQAIEKAKSFGFDLKGSIMASDAFFPFPDCVQIADSVGILSVIQPGGSIKDQLSINYCNQKGISMIMTGIRHFKH